MNKAKIKALILILVLLLAAAAVAAIVVGRTSSELPDETPAPPPVMSSAPSETLPPEESEAPPPSESLEPTPSPEVSDEPVTDREVSGSGSFSSDTGTALNLIVNYSARALDDERAEITFELSLQCYTIDVTAKHNGASLTVDGRTYTFTTPAVSSESATLTTIPLGSQTVEISLAAGETLTLPAAAAWAFGGSYSDVEMDVIEARGSITVEG